MNQPTPAVVTIGVGFDTARYGHHVSFLRADRQPAAPAFSFTENREGYQKLRQALEALQQRYGQVHFHIRIDAAGQYAANLEHFVRSLPWAKTVSLGQPKQNKDYRSVHFPKRKADDVESLACARFAVVEQPPASAATPAAFALLAEAASALQFRVKQTTRLVNQLHNRLARVFPELATLVSNVSAAWVLALLRKYPSADKIAAAHLSSLTAIPHLDADQAQRIQDAARHSVASQRGPVVEGILRAAVEAIQNSKKSQAQLEAVLEQAYDAVPPSHHVRIETIPGIGKKTAAALVAKMIAIERFATADDVVGYFGVFPEENTSGVDKHGQRVPPGTRQMSRKGNDLARGYLWNAAKTAILHNPTIRRLYARKKQAGKRGDVALGHCVQKLLHLVFAVWKSGQPYVPPAEDAAAPPAPAPAEAAPHPATPDQTAVGRTEPGSERQAVTTAAPFMITTAPSADNQSTYHERSYAIDFADVRRQLSIEQVLRAAQWRDCLHAQGDQLRGPCPIHGAPQSRSRSFSVNVPKNVFHCFDASCGAHGNVLDLWAQIRKLSLYEAARELVERFNLRPRNREEEPVKEPVANR